MSYKLPSSQEKYISNSQGVLRVQTVETAGSLFPMRTLTLGHSSSLPSKTHGETQTGCAVEQSSGLQGGRESGAGREALVTQSKSMEKDLCVPVGVVTDIQQEEKRGFINLPTTVLQTIIFPIK